MFTSFSVSSGIPDRPTAPRNASLRTKRQQVARACSWCRTYRIKCDDKIPCQNCVSKGRICSENEKNVRTFSRAIKEIAKLKSRVEELEQQLTVRSPRQSLVRDPIFPEHLDPYQEHGGNQASWEHISARMEASETAQSYGPSSLMYFMRQIDVYLQRSTLVAIAETQKTETPTLTFPKTSLTRSTSSGQNPLNHWQEEKYLDTYWTSYHTIYPIIDEAEFKSHHSSLWSNLSRVRKSSPLVDILLAISMQYAAARSPPGFLNGVPNAFEKGNDPAITGKSYYKRCQALLAAELESPSIMAVQCHILSVIYLLNAGSLNPAHSILALGCRVAMTIGLHREPANESDGVDSNTRRRLWWTLCALEMKLAMELGRPLACSLSEVTCRLPEVKVECSVIFRFSSRFPSTDMSYEMNLQFIKLLLATRAVYTSFWNQVGDIMNGQDLKRIYNNSEMLEAAAEAFTARINYLQIWKNEVPDTLKMRRKDNGEPYSSETNGLVFEPTISLAQQRQQVFLELHYHTSMMNLCRHFTVLSGKPTCPTPQADSHASSSVQHAMAIIGIIYQTQFETDLLRGWLETFHWTWNAFISLFGYLLAYPSCPQICEVRTHISQAIIIFESLSGSLPMVLSALKMARELLLRADGLPKISSPKALEGTEMVEMDMFIPTAFDTPSMFPINTPNNMDWIPSDTIGTEIWTFGTGMDGNLSNWLLEDSSFEGQGIDIC